MKYCCSIILFMSLVFTPLVRSLKVVRSKSIFSRLALPISLAVINTFMMSTSAEGSTSMVFDKEYPGTAVQRLNSVHERVKSLTPDQLNGDWSSVRRKLLWAGGLKDLSGARPGAGYTGHSFNDFNHCDLTTMLGDVASNENNGQVVGIHQSNQLGPGIQIASIEELGPGGSWSTCMIGSNKSPPQDVAHLQFKSRIAFKLVWSPPMFNTFVLVDDAGAKLAEGHPTGSLPELSERRRNFQTVLGGKYAVEATKIAERELAEMEQSST